MRDFALFVLIGGTGAVIYTALNVALTTWAGLRPSVSILITLAILIPPTYLAQHRFAFRSDRPHRAAFPRYVGTQAIGNGVALTMAELFPDIIRAHPSFAFLAVACVVASTNYACLRYWTFRRAR